MSLKITSAFYKSILENLQGDVAILDASFRYVYINPYALSDEESRRWIIGKTDLEFIQYRQRDASFGFNRQAKLEEAKNSKKPVSWTEEMTKKDGTLGYYLRTISPVYNEASGELEYFIGHGLDITDREVIRKELEENKRITDAILNESPNSIFIKDGHGRFVLVNRAVANLFNSTPEEIINRTNSEVHNNEDELNRFFEVDAELIRSMELRRREETFTKADGTVIWFDTVKVPLIEPDGSVRVLGISSDITDRKWKEDLLIKSELRLNEAQSMAKMGSYDWDFTTGEMVFSKGAYEIYEWTFGEPAPNAAEFISMIHPLDQDYYLELWNQLPSRKTDFEVLIRVLPKSGKLKYIQSINKVTLNEKGEIVRVSGSIMDVTDQKMAEEESKGYEQRITEAQEVAKLGNFDIDLINNKVFYSKSALRIYEWDNADVISDAKRFEEMVHPADREYFNSLWALLAERKDTFDANYRIITKTGRVKYIQTINKLERNDKGELVRVHGIIADVTARHEAEEKIRCSENSLIQAQRIAKLGSFYYDIDKRTFDWAQGGVYYIWERDLASVAPNFEEVLATIHREDVDLFKNAFLEAHNSKHRQKVEFRILLENKNIKFLEAQLKAADDEAGTVTKLFGTVIDITERKKVEQELLAAKKLAEDSSKAKELFLANISHELRTPLNGILGMSRLLKKTILSSVQRNYAEVLDQTAENLLVIISEILDFTKIEEGKLTLEEVVFDPSRVADTTVNLQMFKAEEKNILLRHKHIGVAPIPKVIGDPYRLNQILLNLLNNAIKFTNYGEILLTHEITSESDDFIEIQFTVRDSGIGIPVSLQEKIFESFTQLQTENSKQAGVGLGLTISKNLIEKQGGRIWVESTENVGSAFHFLLKYKKAKIELSSDEGTSYEGRGLGTLNVLLAEDNQVNMFITESMLKDWGFQVDVAVNGLEALQMIELNQYDMVLMDIQMPVMDGLQATKRIRELRDFKKSRTPIIALTANTGRQAHTRLMASGMNDWVVKPFKEETLYRKIAMHIKGKEGLLESMKKRKFPARRKPVVSGNEQLYDLSSLNNEDPANRFFMIKMLGIFVDTIPLAVENMITHFEDGDYAEVSRVAHKIKPSIDSVGIILLKDSIRNVEDYKERKRSVAQLKSDIGHIQKVISKVVAVFQKEIAELKKV